jgi:organic hydroperoxide reductase OsmC/OhrA
VHRPQVQLAADATESQIEQALRLAEQAETSCMISRAVAGNVTLSTEPVVERAS